MWWFRGLRVVEPEPEPAREPVRDPLCAYCGKPVSVCLARTEREAATARSTQQGR